MVPLGRSVGAVDIPEGVRYADWRIGDPVGVDLDGVRHIRDELDRRVRQLVTELVPPPAPVETDP